MEHTYEILKDKKLIIEKYLGSFSPGDLEDSIVVMLKDPDFDKSYDGIVDFTAAKLTLKSSDVDQLVQFMKGQDKVTNGRRAIIASDSAITAFSFIYKIKSTTLHRIEIFSTYDAAYRWLGISK
ncbi:MAG: hypothetical protein C0594_16875 [Marinilabiliales bacterium]|nr:MAG: hypothetical protein C0594_16875 [Marinilabiliales bacterium]